MCTPQASTKVSPFCRGYNSNRLKRVGYFRRKYLEAQAPLMLALSLVVVMASASGWWACKFQRRGQLISGALSRSDHGFPAFQACAATQEAIGAHSYHELATNKGERAELESAIPIFALAVASSCHRQRLGEGRVYGCALEARTHHRP